MNPSNRNETKKVTKRKEDDDMKRRKRGGWGCTMEQIPVGEES